jgi:phosphomannomutase
VYFAINAFDCVGGVMTTASHNPVNYNGFKISGPKAKPIGAASGLNDIKRIANVLRQGKTGETAKYETRDITEPYRRHVLKFLDVKRPLKIVIDASNGMAGAMIPAVFGNAANVEIIPMLFEMSGEFVHDPDPMVPANLASLQEKVRETGADLGACFDGDADRVAFVDEQGQIIGCDMITALLARDFLANPKYKGSAVVYDLRSSHCVPEEIRAAGGVALRERAGHSFIKKTMAESEAVFGGELSGHYYFRDNYYADSGAIALARVLSVLSEQNKPFSELIRPFVRYSQSGEMSFQVDDKDARIRFLAEQFKSSKLDYLDGLTIEQGDWWFNVRKSNTEPLLRMNVEANSLELLAEKIAELTKVLK